MERSDIHHRAVVWWRAVVIAAPHDPLTARRAVSARALAGRTWIEPEADAGTALATGAALAAGGRCGPDGSLGGRAAVRGAPLEIVRDLVAAGVGIAIVPDIVARRWPEVGAVPVGGAPLIGWGVWRRTDTAIGPGLGALLRAAERMRSGAEM